MWPECKNSMFYEGLSDLMLGMIKMTDNSAVIQETCESISRSDFDNAGKVISDKYPFLPTTSAGRSYTPRQMTRVFIRDGFTDRYLGTRLIHPPALRVISHYLPAIFPYHKNGKMDVGHVAYWELFPTIDHVVPVARGGSDDETNWVCCSMLTNSIKSNWTLEQLQWKLAKPDSTGKWDGMISWFVHQVEADNQLLKTPYIKNWYYAAKDVLSTTSPNRV
jgi:hypothetical protein